MSVVKKTQIVYEEDKDIDIEEFKWEPIDIAHDISEGLDPLNTVNQNSNESSENGTKRMLGDKNRVACDLCEFEGTRPEFWQHMKSTHTSWGHSCSQCDYVTAYQTNLKQHTKSMHCGIRHPCDQCDYSTPDIGNLNKHRNSKHIGIKFPCDQCSFATTRHDTLKSHKRKKHGTVQAKGLVDNLLSNDQSMIKQNSIDSKEKDQVIKEGLPLQYSCAQCECVCVSVSMLESHKKLHHLVEFEAGNVDFEEFMQEFTCGSTQQYQGCIKENQTPSFYNIFSKC